ncbi:MAG: phage head-tail connector protein [Porcipelethomonas sp.]
MTLKELKNALRITWDDEDSDSRLSGILERAKGILSSYAGKELAFDDTQPFEKQLLIELCRYIDNEALEDFSINYAAELLQLRAKYAVDESGEENEEVQTL